MSYSVISPGARVSITAEDLRAPQESSQSYAFVMNVSRLVNARSFTLAPNHELRLANTDEMSSLKAKLERLMFPPACMWWEYQLPLQGQLVRLPQAEWRYFVIAFHGPNTILSDLEQVFTLAELELRVAFTIVANVVGGVQDGLIMHPGRFFQYLENRPLPWVDVTQGGVDQIIDTFNRYKQHNNTVVNVTRLTRQLLDLDALPHYSPLRFLGYFAILESILTHQPDPDDTIDSIARQVKKKIALLNNRWEPRVDYAAFRSTPPDTVWSKMYSYRSCLAHGNEPDFSRELSLLNDHSTALTLLKTTVKAIIRQAMIEPQLIVDLREC